MRQQMAVGLTTALLAGLAAASVTAQDEDLHIGDDEGWCSLTCHSDERVARDWLDVADTPEWLDQDAPDQLEEPDRTSDFDYHGLQRVELPEAGVSLGLPPDWSVELLLEEKEDLVLPEAYADARPVMFRDLLKAESEAGEWCLLRAHPENPMSLHEHASWERAAWSATFPNLSIELYSADDWGERRYIVMGRGPNPDKGVNLYFFESAGERYELQCSGTFGPDSPWDAIAHSVQPLATAPPEPDPATPNGETQVVELPAAGVELSLPVEWTFQPDIEESSTLLPPPYDDVGAVTIWRALEASAPERSLVQRLCLRADADVARRARRVVHIAGRGRHGLPGHGGDELGDPAHRPVVAHGRALPERRGPGPLPVRRRWRAALPRLWRVFAA